MLSIILDLAVAAILIFSVVRGHRRGFFKTLSGMIVFVLAVFGAVMIARMASPAVGEWMRPAIEDAIRVQIGAESAGASLNDVSVAGVRLGDFDFYSHAVQSAGDGVEAAITAVSMSLANGLAYWLCAIAGFIILVILLNVAARALNVVLRLPVLNFLNKTLGVVAGLIFGLITVYILAQILGFFSGIVPPEAQANTFIFKYVQNPGLLYGLVD